MQNRFGPDQISWTGLESYRVNDHMNTNMNIHIRIHILIYAAPSIIW